jgi:hypothetical protein
VVLRDLDQRADVLWETGATPRWRADRDECGAGCSDRRGQVGRDIQPLGLDVGRHQRIQPRLKDRDVAAVQTSILPASLSTHLTLWPKSAKQAPDTSPTWPVPNHGDAHENNPSLIAP